jgi:hypothetical protein
MFGKGTFTPIEIMRNLIMEKGKRLDPESIAGWRTNPETHTVFPITSAQEKAHPVQDMEKHRAIVMKVAHHVTGTRVHIRQTPHTVFRGATRFWQFPALITVDGKSMSEAEYHKFLDTTAPTK